MLMPANKLSRHERRETHQQHLAERKAEAQALSDMEYADLLEYCLVNGNVLSKRHHQELLTYDNALALIHMPEILRRLRGGEEQPENSYKELLRRRMAVKSCVQVKQNPHKA